MAPREGASSSSSSSAPHPHPHVRTCAVVVMGLLGRHAAAAWDAAASAENVAEADAALLRMRPQFVETLSLLVRGEPTSRPSRPPTAAAASQGSGRGAAASPPRKASKANINKSIKLHTIESTSPGRGRTPSGRTAGREESPHEGAWSPGSEWSLPSFTAPDSEHSDDGDSHDSVRAAPQRRPKREAHPVGTSRRDLGGRQCPPAAIPCY
jgi:hypothetical protein